MFKFTKVFHYALLGIVIGLFFPYVSYVLTLGEQEQHFDLNNILELHKSSNLFFIIDLAPLLVGILFAVIGKLNLEKNSYLISISKLEKKLRSENYNPDVKTSIIKIRKFYISVFAGLSILMVFGLIYFNSSSNFIQKKLHEFTEINAENPIDLSDGNHFELSAVISDLNEHSTVVGYSIFICSLLVLGLISFFIYGHFQINVPGFNKIIKNTLEINIAKQLIQKQSAELKRYSVANNESNTSMTLLDPNGKITWVNKAFESLFELEFENVKNEHIYELFLHGNSKLSKQEIREILKKDSYYQEVIEIRNRANEKIWIKYVIQPYFENTGEMLGYYSLQTDITDLMETKNENEELLLHLNQNMESAKIIQKSINHSEEEMKEFFDNNVLIDIPLQVLSGDFLWFKKISNDEALICLGDCVGHGVAGSLLSTLYTTYLNKLSNLTLDPERLINRLDSEIKLLLSQYNQDSNEFTCELGMIYFNKRDMTMKFAGSNTELFVIGDTINTIKSNRFSIGSSYVQEQLSTKEISLNPDSWVLMASDGLKNMYNKDNKRLKTKGVIELLERAKSEDGAQYAAELQKEIESYLNEATRNDDIFILGVKCETLNQTQ